jgi:N-dimethylarginine dimethylaminohydrolase
VAWDRISVSLAEAAELASNGLPISPDVYVTDPAFGRIGEGLSRRGVTVESVDFRITRMFGGAFRCSTQPLLRRS